MRVFHINTRECVGYLTPAFFYCRLPPDTLIPLVNDNDTGQYHVSIGYDITRENIISNPQ